MPVGLSHVSRQRQRQDHHLPAHQGGGLGHRTVGRAMIEAPCAARVGASGGKSQCQLACLDRKYHQLLIPQHLRLRTS